MADVAHDTGSGGLRASAVVWLAAVAIVGAGAFLAARAIDGGRQDAVRATPSADALSAHCAQFIALAKQQYGPNWKYRLDPRNGSICARHVQQAWDSQWRPGADPRTMPPDVEPAVPPPPAPPAPVFVRVAPTQARMAKSDTYCLNLVSLAKAKYGPGWQNTITREDAEACRARIETMSQ